MTITTVIDLAKNVFAVHCIDQNGKAVLVKPKVSRAALSELIAGLPPCVIGMEAARVPTIGQIIQAVWP
jgi:transposase